jgi:RNA:NAD 2'-phosphotransferase (TPT1/KptA family)
MPSSTTWGISKLLSRLLRHDPDLLVEGKWVLISTLLERDDFKRLNATFQIIIDIVNGIKNEKRRFQISENKKFICATEGHSQYIKHEEIQGNDLPISAMHGTFEICLNLIFTDGILNMDRDYVHLTTELKFLRKSCEYMIIIDIKNAYNNGVIFYNARDGIILSSDISSDYFFAIINIKTSENVLPWLKQGWKF